MNRFLLEIDAILSQVERLASQLGGDPDQLIYRSAIELRATFEDRREIAPALGRMRIGVRGLLEITQESNRRRHGRAATTLDFLDDVLEQELLPRLRRSGFDV